jgi:molybdenum cofactor biosynthesis protein B
MPGIDTSRPFISVRIAVLTVSDSRGIAEDKSGQTLINRLEAAGHTLADRQIVRDEIEEIHNVVNQWLDDENVDVVISTGGTGVTGRDITPEAFDALYEKAIPGFGELFRMLSYQKIGTSTIQSRASAGVSRGTFLFALPGSTGAVKDAWDDILVHQLDYRFMPCNFVELFDRLQEHQKRSKS